MKIMPIAFRLFLLILTGIVLALIGAALNPPAHVMQTLTPTPAPTTLAETPTPSPASAVGTTDRIVVLAVVLVLIVFAPIFWRWRSWMRSLIIG